MRSTNSHHATTGELLLHMLGYMQLQLEAWIGARAFWVQSGRGRKKVMSTGGQWVCAEPLKKKQVQNSYWNGGGFEDLPSTGCQRGRI